MTRLEFKQTQLRNGMVFDYKQHVIDIVRSTPPVDQQGIQKRGFTDADMDEAEALADKIEQANGSVELTAQEVMQLASKVELRQWPFSDKAFRQFVADVIALKAQ
jgi:hypothetical protein